MVTVTLPITPTAPAGIEIDPTAMLAILRVIGVPSTVGPAGRDGLAGLGVPVVRESKTRMGEESRLIEPPTPTDPGSESLKLGAARAMAYQTGGLTAVQT